MKTQTMMQQTTYRHNKSQNTYRIIDHCKLQINNEWVPGYIYVQAHQPPTVYAEKYVRTVTEFHMKFTPVLDEDGIDNIQDGESLLDLIRNGQLASILGKYKLF